MHTSSSGVCRGKKPRSVKAVRRRVRRAADLGVLKVKSPSAKLA